MKERKQHWLFIIVLILCMMSTNVICAQNSSRPWATLCNGTLTFSYGNRPVVPSQIICPQCNKSMAYSNNYCGNCGKENTKGFAVFEVPLSAQKAEIVDYDNDEELIKIQKRVPWYKRLKEVKRVTFEKSFKHVSSITSTSFWFCTEMDSSENGNGIMTFTGLENLNTSNVLYMVCMFSGCEQVRSLNLSSFDTRKVRDMWNMFSGCSSLFVLNLNGWNTSNVRNMGGMFLGCEKLMSIDLLSFDTSNVTDMGRMFMGCDKLTSLNVSAFRTPNVRNMSYMFAGCRGLSSLDIRKFNTSKTEAMIGMFESCEHLGTIVVSTGWDTSHARNNAHTEKYTLLFSCDNGVENMFENCPARIVYQ